MWIACGQRRLKKRHNNDDDDDPHWNNAACYKADLDEGRVPLLHQIRTVQNVNILVPPSRQHLLRQLFDAVRRVGLFLEPAEININTRRESKSQKKQKRKSNTNLGSVSYSSANRLPHKYIGSDCSIGRLLVH